MSTWKGVHTYVFKYQLKSKWDTITIILPLEIIVVVQLLSHVQLFVTLWTAACQASILFTISRSLLKLIFIESVTDRIILCHPSSPPLNISQNQGLFQWVGSSHQVAKVMEFQLQHSPSNSGLISLGLTGLILLLSKGLSRVLSEPQFESINFLALNLLYSSILTSVCDYWKKPQLWLYGHLSAKW